VQSITRLLLASILAGALPPSPYGFGEPGAVRWRDASDYLDLLAPVNQHQAYAIAVTPASLENVLVEVAADQTAVRAPGAWQPRSESAQDAFGTAGLYNRWLLARLYGSQQLRVARGARMDRGRVVESWTLISPYPSPDLRTLHPGTMRLILTVSPAFAAGFGGAGTRLSP
jgi:hypothetical protein